jgi:SAM-dependent methyltransferase
MTVDEPGEEKAGTAPTDPGPTDKDPALSFGEVAAAYDAGRPGYPPDALRWILGTGQLTVLDLGAGTGKLSAVLAGLGHEVIAVDPSEQLLEYAKKVPGVDTKVGSAEGIPLGPASVDAVVAGQAFHWFDADKALAEIARVLRPGGMLGLLWNDYDTVVPWVRRFAALVQEGDAKRHSGPDPMSVLIRSPLFGMPERKSFRHWHDLDRAALRQLAQSISRIALLPESRRLDILDQVDAVYESSARPPEPLRLPYVTGGYRVRSSDLAPYARGAGSED